MDTVELDTIGDIVVGNFDTDAVRREEPAGTAMRRLAPPREHRQNGAGGSPKGRARNARAGGLVPARVLEEARVAAVLVLGAAVLVLAAGGIAAAGRAVALVREARAFDAGVVVALLGGAAAVDLAVVRAVLLRVLDALRKDIPTERGQ